MNLTLVFVHLFLALAAFDDLDRDGLDDELEQQLLVRYLPEFQISVKDCDALPAEFAAGSVEPRVVAKNGTIYGQVFKNGPYTEIHYYHLWSRDCGRTRHKYDVEHVSVLLSAEDKALYWYAASHEDTVCDSSSGARAADLGFEDRGAKIWISHGKHASFLSREKCGLGCGVDQCRATTAMPPGKLINIGEAGFPLNGAVWTASPRWSLRSKMRPDFTPPVIAQLDEREAPGIAGVNDSLSPVKAIILGGDSGLDGAITGNRHGGKAIITGGAHGVKAAGTGVKHAGKGLFRAGRAVARALGARKKN